MSRLVHRRRFTPLLVGEHGFASDFDSDVGPGGGSGPPDPPDEPVTLPDPVIVANAVPAMRIAMHSEFEAANDWEFGAQWTITDAGTFTTGDGGSMGYMRLGIAAGGAIGGRETTLADWPADHSPVFNSFVYPQTITNMRYFVGFTTLSLANQLASRIPAGVYFGLVFDSAVDTYWACVCSDGVGYTEVATTVAPTPSLRQIIRGDLDFGVDARFYIDGIRVGLIDANLPPTGSNMRQANGMINTHVSDVQYAGILFEEIGSIGGGL